MSDLYNCELYQKYTSTNGNSILLIHRTKLRFVPFVGLHITCHGNDPLCEHDLFLKFTVSEVEYELSSGTFKLYQKDIETYLDYWHKRFNGFSE